MTQLNPLAVQNAALLRELIKGDADRPETAAELGRRIGRDESNVRKTVKLLRSEGLIAEGDLTLTDEGIAQVETIARAEGEPMQILDGGAADQIRLRHDQIMADPENARRDWDSEEAQADLLALAIDIRDNDLLQNLVVRRGGGDRFILVGGERRWRAIDQLIGLGHWPSEKLIPCRLLAADDVGIRLAALSENLQRRALNPIEEATAYKSLRDVGLSTDDIAARVSMTQRHIQGRLQLLEHLTEDQQRRMTLAGDDKDRLSVSDARKLVQQGEARRKALEAAEAAWTPRQRLVFVEVVLARPNPYYGSRVPVDPWAMDQDEDAAALHKAGMLTLPTTVDLDGKAVCWLESKGFALLQSLFPDGPGQHAFAATYAAALRAELDLPPAKEGEISFSTPWLNPPFEIPAEVEADLAQRRAARDAENAAVDAERATAAAERQALRDQIAEARGEAETLMAGPGPSVVALDAAPAIAERLERRLPWRATEDGTVIDADGEQVMSFCDLYRGPGDREIGLAMLTVAAVNTAAGLQTPPLAVREPEQAADGSDPDADDAAEEEAAEPAEEADA